MNIIISSELNDSFSQFKVFASFKAVRESVEDLGLVDVLVIHRFPESDFDAGVFISDFRSAGMKHFIYINSDASTTIRMVISGVEGKYFSDEFYFDDEEELLALMEDMDETEEATEVAVPALDILNDFIDGFVKKDERINAPLYLERASLAITELEAYTRQTETKLVEMGASATHVFERASSIIRKLDNNKRIIEQKLRDLEENQSSSPQHSSVLANNVLSFPSVKYTGNLKILQIREYAPCRYLTTFCLGYLHHVHYELNKRVKLVFVHQKSAGTAKKYGDFTVITQSSMNSSSLYDSEIIATNIPKKDVLANIWSRQAEVLIFVDRLYGNMNILSGRVVTVNAVSGASDLERYKISASDTIFSVTEYPDQMFCIPTLKGFPRDVDAKYASYAQVMEEAYKTLDRRLGIG